MVSTRLAKKLLIVILPALLAVAFKYLNFNQLLGVNLGVSQNANIFGVVGMLLSAALIGLFWLKVDTSKIEHFLSKNEKWVIGLIIGVVALIYAFLTINQHAHFQTHAFDLGIYDRTAWQYGQLRFGYFEDMVGMKKMADHFEPLLFLPGIVYWLIKTPIILLIFEAFVVALGFLPIYLIGKKLLKNRLASIFIGLAFTCFAGVLSAVTFPIHPGAWLATFYGFAIYFAIEKKFSLYYLFLILAMLSKESAALHLLYIGLFVWLILKQWKHGVATMVLGVLFYVLAVKFLMPSLNGGQPYVHGVFGNISNDPIEFVKFIVSHPLKTLQILFDQPVKGQTFWLTLGSTGFLAVLSPLFILLILPMLFERLITEHFGMITMNFQYSIPVSVMLFISTIWSIKWLSSKYKIKNLALYLAGFCFVCSFFIGSGYTFMRTFKTIKIRPVDRAGYNILKFVPKNASIIAQESLVPHLSYRSKITLFGGGVNGYDYILLSKDADFPSWPVGPEVVSQTIANLRQNKAYMISKENEYFILFKKR